MDTEDRRLIKQYRSGDVEALSVLVEKYRRPLFGFILNMTEGHGDADEIFQETWFRAIRKFDSYRQKNFMGWLVRIARNLVIDRYRRKRPTVSLDMARDDEGTPAIQLVDSAPGPTDNAVTEDDMNAVKRAVDTLPEEQKEVFVMRMQTGLSFKEIAKAQGVSINTALARMQYALSKLRPLLQNEYDAMRDEL
ncbi:MAG: sigma-70 family RNA polymerase sigma factor [Kiritimatiellia bacterium]|jgi:RNA polymerase sigma-70 factor (ECF subfamily)|nr:sigma-70 family RNA polymerase sigma factor [Kiritimatiellia bacterium]MDP6630471.1 sigma-70 family RNA polymerase sigma factor [Kiritimatiellia bacterium]MDP6809928.1 sigma-70 family RNA polymerase sigma factor [Kiritimatiellia bacterium]MDP7025018.1 sigma-70 family RNA polymerase sigma factor [Kiritimatiellia bacterium]